MHDGSECQPGRTGFMKVELSAPAKAETAEARVAAKPTEQRNSMIEWKECEMRRYSIQIEKRAQI